MRVLGLWFLLGALVVGLPSCRRDQAAAQDSSPDGAYPFALPVTAPDGVERPIIDAHSHLFGLDSWPDVQAIMDANGVDIIVNLSGGSPRRGMRAATELAAASGGRVQNAMTINWAGFGEPAWAAIVALELELCVREYGYVALKISKALGLGVPDLDGSLVAVDDPRLFPIWAKAGELGVPVFIHTGDPLAFWEPTTPANERFDELLAHPRWSFAGPEYPARDELLAQRDHLLELFPGTTFVAVHFGSNPEDLDYVDQLLTRFPNVYVDLAARLPEIGRHDPERVRDLMTRHRNRILFATDIAIGRTPDRELVLILGSSGSQPAEAGEVPEFYNRHFRFLETSERGMAHPTPIQGRWTIDAAGLPAEVLQAIYWQNAYDLIVAPRFGSVQE